jgi:hypothetical protein
VPKIITKKTNNKKEITKADHRVVHVTTHHKIAGLVGAVAEGRRRDSLPKRSYALLSQNCYRCWTGKRS